MVMVLFQHGRLEAFFSFEFEDAALYHQLLFNVGDGQWIVNTIHPLHRPSHLSPLFFLLWPLYALLGGGWVAVFIIKSVLVGSGAVAVFMLARSQSLSERDSLLWAAIYLLFPPVIVLTLSPLRPMVLALGPLLFLLWSFTSERWKSFLLWMIVVLFLREDLALSVATLSLIAFLMKKEARWVLTPAVVSLSWFVVAVFWLLPNFLPAPYGTIIMGTNLSEAGFWDSLRYLFEPTHIVGALALLLPLCFLPLGSWFILFAAVGVASFMLNWRPFVGNLVHMTTPAVAAVVCSAVVSQARLAAKKPRLLAAVLLCLCVSHVQALVPASFAPPAEPNSAWSPFDPSFYEQDALDKIRWKAVAAVPDDVSVTAVGHFLPALAPRSLLYEYGHPDVPFLEADWFLLEARNLFAGGGSYFALDPTVFKKQRAILAPYVETRFEQDGIVLLERK